MTISKDLAVLESAGLVSVAALQPDLEYMFRHALLQDAAYASLLKQERRELHRRVAEALDGLYPQRREELAGIVAMHLEEAGAADDAARRYLVAGQHALARFAKAEARAFYERVLALTSVDDPRIEVRDLRVRAIVGSTRAGWTKVPAEPEARRIAAALADAEATHDLRLIADAHFWHAMVRRGLGETPETSPEMKRSLDRARELATQGGDALGLAMVEGFHGAGLALTGKMREGAVLLEEHVPLIEAQGDPLSAALLLDLLTVAYARLGRFVDAEASLARAEQLAQGGDPIAQLDALIARATLAAERGEEVPAIELATQCARDADALGAPACAVGANILVGTGHLRLDDAAGARAALERGYQIALTLGLPPLRSITEGLLRVTAVRLGEDPDDRAWDDALAGARRFSDRFGEGTILAERAAARMRAGARADERVLPDLESAVALFEEIEARPALARALRERARAGRAVGRHDDASDDEARAAAIETQLGIRPRGEAGEAASVRP